MFKTADPSLKSLRILVVEDDLASLELIYEVLQSLEVDVFPASDSERALAVAQTEKFDGIILDLNMPRIDGFTIMEVVRSSGWNQQTPIVVITGMGDRDTMRRAFAAGATFFLRKPLERRQITALLNSTRGAMLMNRRRFRRIPLIVEITANAGSGARQIHSLDLSEGGMLVEGLKLDSGKGVHLSFRLDRAMIAVQATVKRTDKEGRTGLLFQDLKPPHQQLIREFIDAQDLAAERRLPTKAS